MIHYHFLPVQYTRRYRLIMLVGIIVFLGDAWDMFLWSGWGMGKKRGLEVGSTMLDGVAIYLVSDIVSMIAKYTMDADLFVLAKGLDLRTL